MQNIKERESGKIYTGERALFQKRNFSVNNAIFQNGESPLKECKNIEVNNCEFKWKYPLWYCEAAEINNGVFLENARAGIWYSKDIEISDTLIEAPKILRRSDNIRLRNVSFSYAKETMWNCSDIYMDDVYVYGDYFGMNCTNVKAENLVVSGNYLFDGAKNIEVSDSKLISKDAFWNCENVVVVNSSISGEYIGWNSKNLTFKNCRIESLQGLCRIENLTLVDCTLLNTTLAFEYSEVNAKISGSVESVFNPVSGIIEADYIGRLIIQGDKVDASKTRIVCDDVGEISDIPFIDR